MIHVIDDWYIDADENQYVSGILYVTPKSEQRLTKRNYHGTLSRAIQRIENERKRERVSKSSMELNEAVKTLQNLDNEFLERLKEAGIE